MSLVSLLLALAIVLIGLTLVTTLGEVAVWLGIIAAVAAVVLDFANKDRHLGR